MPQLDFFTLLFQFKSFFFFFCLLYLFFVFVIVPKLHLVISVRRRQILMLFGYISFLKGLIFESFAFQCLFLKTNIFLFNELFMSFFNRFLDSKFSVTNFLFFNKL
jgi:hypothetical protein